MLAQDIAPFLLCFLPAQLLPAGYHPQHLRQLLHQFPDPFVRLLSAVSCFLSTVCCSLSATSRLPQLLIGIDEQDGLATNDER